MIVLRLASLTAALATIILNAAHGFAASNYLPYAILLATLQAALDIGKCALPVAMAHALRQQAYTIALLCALLFPALFVNSVWNAMSQVAITRDEGKASKVSDAETRSRHRTHAQRLARDVALLEANSLYKDTAACVQARTSQARTFCASVAKTKSDLAAAEKAMTAIAPVDPQPEITALAALLPWPLETIQLALAVIPVLLAEALASLGFVISARAEAMPPKTTLRARFKNWLAHLRPSRKTAPETQPGASKAASNVGVSPQAAPAKLPFRIGPQKPLQTASR